MTIVKCKHRREGNHCAINAYGTQTISDGICLNQCSKYDGPDRTKLRQELINLTLNETKKEKKICGNADIWYWPTFRWNDSPVSLCRWYGIPMPIRWWKWIFDSNHPKPSSHKGCGCILKLKVLWLGVKWVAKKVKEA